MGSPCRGGVRDSYGVLPRPCRALVLLNPQSGAGRALEDFQAVVQPMLAEADIATTVFVTERAHHAHEKVRDEDLSQWDTLVVMSGDGLLYEQRPRCQEEAADELRLHPVQGAAHADGPGVPEHSLGQTPLLLPRLRLGIHLGRGHRQREVPALGQCPLHPGHPAVLGQAAGLPGPPLLPARGPRAGPLHPVLPGPPRDPPQWPGRPRPAGDRGVRGGSARRLAAGAAVPAGAGALDRGPRGGVCLRLRHLPVPPGHQPADGAGGRAARRLHPPLLPEGRHQPPGAAEDLPGHGPGDPPGLELSPPALRPRPGFPPGASDGRGHHDGGRRGAGLRARAGPDPQPPLPRPHRILSGRNFTVPVALSRRPGPAPGRQSLPPTQEPPPPLIAIAPGGCGHSSPRLPPRLALPLLWDSHQHCPQTEPRARQVLCAGEVPACLIPVRGPNPGWLRRHSPVPVPVPVPSQSPPRLGRTGWHRSGPCCLQSHPHPPGMVRTNISNRKKSTFFKNVSTQGFL
ncbi:sphingosine kinase 1 isoform X2 [Heliangelus exortis]|uniref:sphingosine kinase 1 isoform X2 n=1 Tax=Heliangelus exortis TaxID=472823 RepID=UPI003A92651A